jgi:aerobic-type carbon monoxide dehydrogenase small subunit (CoxS/CutS family)
MINHEQAPLKVNGRNQTVDIDPTTPLLYVLRNDLGLQGPHFGCGLGQRGACTVLINGNAVRSCITPCSAVKGEITTLEGLAVNGKLHPLQQAWIDEQVPQCGFCQNGQILTAKAMLDKTPQPTDAQIRQSMNNTLCRCMSYYRIQSAIKRAARTIASSNEPKDVVPSNIPHQIEDALRLHRRDFLRSAGLLAVSVAAFTKTSPPSSRPYPDPDFHQIDSWIVIHPDNTATFSVGKTDPGQGTSTAFRQLMSDELDIAFEHTKCIMGSTDITVDQIGSGGSTSLERDSWPMRRVAAEARRVLLDSPPPALASPSINSPSATQSSPRNPTPQSASPTANSSPAGSSTSRSPAPTSTPSRAKARTKTIPEFLSTGKSPSATISPPKSMARSNGPSISTCPACSTPAT